MMQDVQIAVTAQHVRLQFDVEGHAKSMNWCCERSSSLPCLRVSFHWARGRPMIFRSSDSILKASASRNDFLIIDSVDAPQDIQELSKRLCDRHLGVGADGVEWLFPSGDADVAARLINADGSEAEILVMEHEASQLTSVPKSPENDLRSIPARG